MRGLNNTQSMNNLHMFNTGLTDKHKLNQHTPSNNNRLVITQKHSNEESECNDDLKEDQPGQNYILKNSAKPNFIDGMKQTLSASESRKNLGIKPNRSFINLQSEKLYQRRNQFKEKKLSLTQHVKISIVPTEEDN